MTTIDPEKAELLRRISFIEDAKGRIKLLVQYGLRDETLAELRELMGTKVFYFNDQSRGRDDVLIGKKPEGFEGVGENDLPILDQVVACIEDTGTLKLRGLMEFFGWDEPALGEFLKEVFASTLKLDPRQNLWRGEKRIMCSWEFSATLKAARHFLPEDSDLRRQVELWVNRAHFMSEYGHIRGGITRYGQVEFWTGKTFDVPDRERALVDRDSGHDNYTYMFDVLAERLTELGLSPDEIAEDYAVAIERNGPQMQPVFTAGLLTSRVVQGFDADRKVRTRIIICDLLPKIFDRYLLRDGLKKPSIDVLMRVVGRETPEPLRVTFRETLIERLADGRFLQAIEAARVYASRIDSRYLRHENDPIDHQRITKVDLSSLAAEAFGRAFKAERSGVAALLAIVFGADACFDRNLLARTVSMEDSDRDTAIEELCAERRTQIREAYGIAMAVGQTANLDFNFVSALAR